MTESKFTAEEKAVASQALKKFLSLTGETVLTPTLHVFAQPDGLKVAFNGGRMIAMILHGNMYTLDAFTPTAPAREGNAFVQADFDVLKKAYKITEELPEEDFYAEYMAHSLNWAQNSGKEVAASFGIKESDLAEGNKSVKALAKAGEKSGKESVHDKMDKIKAETTGEAEALEEKSIFGAEKKAAEGPVLKNAFVTKEGPQNPPRKKSAAGPAKKAAKKAAKKSAAKKAVKKSKKK